MKDSDWTHRSHSVLPLVLGANEGVWPPWREHWCVTNASRKASRGIRLPVSPMGNISPIYSREAETCLTSPLPYGPQSSSLRFGVTFFHHSPLRELSSPLIILLRARTSVSLDLTLFTPFFCHSPHSPVSPHHTHIRSFPISISVLALLSVKNVYTRSNLTLRAA